MIIRNRCAFGKIAPDLRPLIDEAVASYLHCVRDSVASVRLLGSVARGDAILGASDIDFLALLRRPADAATLEALDHEAAKLGHRYPQVSHIHLDAVPKGDLEDTRWFILRTDSLRLYGNDEIMDEAVTIERAELVRLITPPALDLIRGYQAALVAANDPAAVQRLARVTGKDLLKSLRGLALERGADYEVTINRIYRQVVEVVPEHRDLAHRLYEAYIAPDHDRERLSALLLFAAQELEIPEGPER